MLVNLRESSGPGGQEKGLKWEIQGSEAEIRGRPEMGKKVGVKWLGMEDVKGRCCGPVDDLGRSKPDKFEDSGLGRPETSKD